MLQVAAESGVPCTMVTTHKIESRMDTTAQKKWRNQAHAGTVAQLLAPAVGQHSRQRSVGKEFEFLLFSKKEFFFLLMVFIFFIIIFKTIRIHEALIVFLLFKFQF